MRLACMLLLAGAVSTSALAEGTDTRAGGKKAGDGQRHGMMKHDCDEMQECITEGLNLTQDQQQRIRSIMENAREKREALREDTHRQVRQVLTPEQARKLDEHRDEMMRYRAERMRDKADRMDDRAKDMKKEQKDQRQKQGSPRQDSPPSR